MRGAKRRLRTPSLVLVGKQNQRRIMENEIKLEEGYYIVKVTADDMTFVGKISEIEQEDNAD